MGLVAQLPHSELLAGGLKGMLKSAFADVLTPEITSRRKQTFQAPMLSWVAGPLAPWIAEHTRGLPHLPELPGGPRRVESTRQAYQLWSVALLEGWRRAANLSAG